MPTFYKRVSEAVFSTPLPAFFTGKSFAKKVSKRFRRGCFLGGIFFQLFEFLKQRCRQSNFLQVELGAKEIYRIRSWFYGCCRPKLINSRGVSIRTPCRRPASLTSSFKKSLSSVKRKSLFAIAEAKVGASSLFMILASFFDHRFRRIRQNLDFGQAQ